MQSTAIEGTKFRCVEILTTPAPGLPQRRLRWVDAAKGIGILGVIAIHVTADSAGLPYAAYPYADRLPAAMLRAVATALNYPLFLVASFFLLGLGLSTREDRYSEVIGSRLRRLVPPFLLWSLAYLLIRNLKAFFFNYHEAYVAELLNASSWLRYAILGEAQYHLHFLALLVSLTLMYPAFRPALRHPALGLLLFATVAVWPQFDAWIYGNVADLTMRPYLLRLSKLLAYTGYGLLGFGMAGVWRSGFGIRARLALLCAAVVGASSLTLLVLQAREVATAGEWLNPNFITHLARCLLPAAVFVAMAASAGVPWPQWLTQLGALSFAMYLIHPAVLDVIEIAERGVRLSPLLTIALNFVIVTLTSLLLVSAARRTRAGRWALALPPKGTP